MQTDTHTHTKTHGVSINVSAACRSEGKFVEKLMEVDKIKRRKPKRKLFSKTQDK